MIITSDGWDEVDIMYATSSEQGKKNLRKLAKSFLEVDRERVKAKKSKAKKSYNGFL